MSFQIGIKNPLAEVLEGKGGELPLTAPSNLSPEDQVEYMKMQKIAEKFRVRRDDHFVDERYLLKMGEAKCLTRGDLIAVTGYVKAGKSTFLVEQVAAVLSGKFLKFKAVDDPVETHPRVVWIDTEQYQNDTQKILSRVSALCGREVTDDELLVYSVRGSDLMGNKRAMLILLLSLVNTKQPDMLILDGVRDFVQDFNDPAECYQFVLQLMNLASGKVVSISKPGNEPSADATLELGTDAPEAEAVAPNEPQRKPCALLCCLHLNKSRDNQSMMGHLGGELARRASEIYMCSKDENSKVFTVEQKASRGRPWDENFSYYMNTVTLSNGVEVGMPVDLSQASSTSQPAKDRFVTVLTPVSDRAGKVQYPNADEFLQRNNLKEAFCKFIMADKAALKASLKQHFMDYFLVNDATYNTLLQKALDDQLLDAVDFDDQHGKLVSCICLHSPSATV